MQSPIQSTAYALLTIVSLLTACSSDSATGSSDSGRVDAGPQGDVSPDFTFNTDTSDAVDDGADVASDETTQNDASIDANPPGTLGDGCFAERDCSEGELCIGADGSQGIEGYCTILDCETHSDCDFGSSDVFCCSDYPQARGCFLEAEGTVGGGGEGEQGDSCEDGGQSDCEGSSHFCVDLYSQPFCAQFCRPRSGPNQPGSCPDGNWCLETGGGNGLCLPEGENESHESCANDPFQCGEGMVCDGAWQDPPAPFSFCTPLCQADRDCPEEEWCRLFPSQDQGTCLPEGDAEVGDSCAEDRWACGPNQFCMNENTRYAQCTNFCRTESNCERGFYCQFFGEAGVCLPEGDRETGEACADDPSACLPEAFCIGGWGPGYNPDAYCSEECSDDEDICGDDFFCQDFDESSHCIPDGDADIRDECESSQDCPEGTACMYLNRERSGRCQPGCESSDQCEDDEWCAGQICLPIGDADPGDECGDDPFSCGENAFCGGGGEEYCVAVCTDDDSICTGDTHCAGPNEEGDSYCVITGDTAVGESCDDAHECVEGAFCIFNDGEEDGVCSHGCNTDNDCFSGSWCLHAGGATMCVPEGNLDTGESCDEDRFACGEHNLCFYADTDDAFCAQECTGFANSCDEGEVCQFVGFHANFCLPIGDVEAGGSCADDPAACDEDSLCLGAGSDDAFCARTCSFDSERCEGDNVCHFFANGLGLCVPPDFEEENTGGPL